MTIREIYKNSEQFLNKEVKLGGWIRSIRGSKHFGFLVLHDGTFFKPIQVVYEEKLENFQEISKMNVGAAVIVEGTLVPTPQAKQPFEIQAATVTLEGASAPETSQLRIFKNNFSSSSKNKYIPGSVPYPFYGSVCDSPVFSGEGICLCSYTAHYSK